jgi:P27 family predicted phage terminase small subunit
MPTHLDTEARKEWKRISVELEKLGLVAKIDRAALGVYCVAYSRWAKAEKNLKNMGDDGLIDTTPSQYKQISVWLQISNRAVEQMHKFLAEFGMTPSARNRVSVTPQQELFPQDANGQQPATGRFFK